MADNWNRNQGSWNPNQDEWNQQSYRGNERRGGSYGEPYYDDRTYNRMHPDYEGRDLSANMNPNMPDFNRRAMPPQSSARDYGTFGRDNDLGRSSNLGYEGTFGDSRSSESFAKNYAGRGPKGWKRADDRIKEEVCDTLERDPRIDASEIEVDVKDGLVTLRGSVEDRSTKRMAEGTIENLPGVRDVRNELSVNQSLFQQAKDVLAGRSTSAAAKNEKVQRSTGPASRR